MGNNEIQTNTFDSDKETAAFIHKEYELALNTQNHFNDLIIKFRTLGFSVIGVFLTAGIGSLTTYNTWLALGIFLVTAILLYTFKELDINYYHQMLLGAVEKTENIDQVFKGATVKLLDRDYEIFGLTTKISDKVRRNIRNGEEHKSILMIRKFYISIMLVLGLLMLFCMALIIFDNNLVPDDQNQPSQQVYHIYQNSDRE